jgi:3-phenylpropionate/cinnamic acid dioxygenase small subunit
MTRRTIFGAIVISLAVAGYGYIHAQPAKKFTVEDYYEIQSLYYTYAHSIDAGQGDVFASTFVEDGEFTHGYGPGQADAVRTPAKGIDALKRSGSISGTRHFVTNLLITPTGEGAKGTCYLLMYTARTTPPSFVETAIYDDTLVKTRQGWKFKKREVWRDDDDITPFKPKPLPARAGDKE